MMFITFFVQDRHKLNVVNIDLVWWNLGWKDGRIIISLVKSGVVVKSRQITLLPLVKHFLKVKTVKSF
jgi:hypothetical protein